MGTERTDLYHVRRAPRAPGPGLAPALVLLHGFGASELDLLPLAEELDGQFDVVAVRAPLNLGPGYAWYQFDQVGKPEEVAFRSSLAGLSDFLEQLPRIYPVDPRRVYTLGFSQGAVMAGAILLAHPKFPAGTVMLSGYLPLASMPSVRTDDLKGKAVFVGHGQLDPVIPIQFGRESRAFFERVGADLAYHEYPIAHYIGPKELADVEAWFEK